MKKTIIILISLVMIYSLVGCGGNKDKVAVDKDITEQNKQEKDASEEKNNEDKVEEKDKETEKQEEKELEEKEKEEVIPEGKAVNPLTGELIDEVLLETRPIAVQINNHKRAIPQTGISKADIIYEAPVESPINRLLCVFQDYNIDKIGPVRSARKYFIDLAFNNDSIYVHHGFDPILSHIFPKVGSEHMDAYYWEGTLTFRDNARKAPHNSYTKGTMIDDTIKAIGLRKKPDENFKHMFEFNKEDTDIVSENDAKYVKVPYSNYIVSEFEYDEKEKVYRRFQFGQPHIDTGLDEKEDRQLKTKNIIIQYANVYRRANDDAGRLDIDLVSSGKACYITNGKMKNIKWEKKAHKLTTNWFDENGEQLKLNKGKTWICIVPLNMKINYVKQ